MYDIFAVSFIDFERSQWNKIKEKYPTAILCENVRSFSEIANKSLTKMFWVIWDDIILDENFDLNSYRPTKWDDIYIHVFKNGNYFDGIALFPKNSVITKDQLMSRLYPNKKQIEIVASHPVKFEIFDLSSYQDYESALKESKTDMFWTVWPEIKVTDPSVFNLYFSHHDIYNRNENHVFKNSRMAEETFVNGLVLCSKNKPISQKEFRHRYLINKKEHDRIVSKNAYPKFVINTYEEYLKIQETVSTDMFWIQWPEIKVTDESVFDLYFDQRNGIYDKDRAENHAWQHQFRADEVTYGGLHLMCKNKPVSKKEIDFRFLINKKEHAEIVSQHRLYDIVFISYNEPNADENYRDLKKRFPNAKRIDGVTGIHQAHIEAAKLSDTEMFWVVDGDAKLVDNFKFDLVVNRYELDIVHIWQSINPINGLIYGYGGVKLLPTQMTIDMDVTMPDMTTSVSNKVKIVPILSNITAFNTDPFNTWKSAFRECAKLASKTIKRQNEDETNARLETWTTVGHNRPFGEYAIRGARDGMEYGLSNKSDISLINDFNWLKEKFCNEV